MLDIKFIRENKDLVKEGAQSKGVDIDVDKILELDKKRVKLIQEVDELRVQRKSSKKPTPEEIKKIKKVKEGLDKKEEELKKINDDFSSLMQQIPNLPREDVKFGKDGSSNEVLRKEGKVEKLGFKPKDHLELGESLDIIDVKRATKVSGTRFGYIKGGAALLEIALVQYTFDILVKEGFIPVFPPVMISNESMKAMGYLEHGGNDETYHFEKDNLYLVGTSEQSVGPMHQNEIFDEKELPRRYVAFSTCFRREAGSYGKDTKGIFRVHQFDKVEMFSFTKPEDSEKEHEFLLKVEEKITKGLGLFYQVVKMCTGDLGMPAARKYDIECWIPSQNKYRETHSTSTCTDFQARRLNIKYRTKDGKLEFVHTLNGTAVALGRMIIAILENYQQKDGSIEVPRILQKYCGIKRIERKKR